MSLKAFHIVFVTLSILLSFFCGVWFLCQCASAPGRPAALLAAGIGCLAAGVGLICYGKSVARKLKHISYL
jgi:hypothetical protein